MSIEVKVRICGLAVVDLDEETLREHPEYRDMIMVEIAVPATLVSKLHIGDVQNFTITERTAP